MQVETKRTLFFNIPTRTMRTMDVASGQPLGEPVVLDTHRTRLICEKCQNIWNAGPNGGSSTMFGRAGRSATCPQCETSVQAGVYFG